MAHTALWFSFGTLCLACGSNFTAATQDGAAGAAANSSAGMFASGNQGGELGMPGGSPGIGGNGGRASRGGTGNVGGSVSAGGAGNSNAGGAGNAGGALGAGGSNSGGSGLGGSITSGGNSSAGTNGSSAGAAGSTAGTVDSGGSSAGTGEPTAGSGGASAGSGGNGGPDCASLENTYLADLAAARVCDVGSGAKECSKDSVLPDSCGCSVPVNMLSSSTSAAQGDLQKMQDAGCSFAPCGTLCSGVMSASCTQNLHTAGASCTTPGGALN